MSHACFLVGRLVFLNPCGPTLVESIGFFGVSLTPPTPSILPGTLPQASQSLLNVCVHQFPHFIFLILLSYKLNMYVYECNVCVYVCMSRGHTSMSSSVIVLIPLRKGVLSLTDPGARMALSKPQQSLCLLLSWWWRCISIDRFCMDVGICTLVLMLE